MCTITSIRAPDHTVRLSEVMYGNARRPPLSTEKRPPTTIDIGSILASRQDQELFRWEMMEPKQETCHPFVSILETQQRKSSYKRFGEQVMCNKAAGSAQPAVIPPETVETKTAILKWYKSKPIARPEHDSQNTPA